MITLSCTFNSMFQSIDASVNEEDNMLMQIPSDTTDPMKKRKVKLQAKKCNDETFNRQRVPRA